MRVGGGVIAVVCSAGVGLEMVVFWRLEAILGVSGRGVSTLLALLG